MLSTPDVVDERVEPAALGLDARDQSFDRGGLEVVASHCDSGAAGGRHELPGLLDRLRPAVLRAPLPGGPPGAIDGHTRLPESHRGAAAGTPCCTRDEGNLPSEASRRSHLDGGILLAQLG